MFYVAYSDWYEIKTEVSGLPTCGSLCILGRLISWKIFLSVE